MSSLLLTHAELKNNYLLLLLTFMFLPGATLHPRECLAGRWRGKSWLSVQTEITGWVPGSRARGPRGAEVA